MEACAGDFDMAALVNLLTMYTHMMQPPGPSLLSTIKAIVHERSQPDAKEQIRLRDLTNIIWACSKMDYRCGCAQCCIRYSMLFRIDEELPHKREIGRITPKCSHNY